MTVTASGSREYGIPTTYNGTRFRSRLEARWSAFFDRLDWRWTYEPLDVSGYIPDFLIHGARPFFVEVGPCITLQDYVIKAAKPDRAASELRHDLLVVGVVPIAEFDSRCVGADEHSTAGWLGEFMSTPPDSGDYPEAYGWDAGLWGQCGDCGVVGPIHSEMSYVIRPCGHHQSGGFGDVVHEQLLIDYWADAGNKVQWRSR